MCCLWICSKFDKIKNLNVIYYMLWKNIAKDNKRYAYRSNI